MSRRATRTLVLVALLISGLLLAATAWAQSVPGTLVQQAPTRLDAANLTGHSHTSAATISFTVPSGNYLYLTGVDIVDCAGGSAVTAAAPTFLTISTGSIGGPGLPQWMIGSGATAGLCQPGPSVEYVVPVKITPSAGTVVFTMPTFATNQTVSVNLYGYTAP